jgi:nucleotide-binding universal stress UspA family protein
MFGKILVPIDVGESEVAKQSLEVAVKLAATFGSKLRLIHVAPSVVSTYPMAVIPPSIYENVGVYEKTQLDQMADEIVLPKECVSTVVRIGGVYPELLAEAEDWEADLMVVGAHRPSMASFLLGSTAAALSRHAKCTVMIVRSPLQARFI